MALIGGAVWIGLRSSHHDVVLVSERGSVFVEDDDDAAAIPPPPLASPSPVAPAAFPIEQFPVGERDCDGDGLLRLWGCWYAHVTRHERFTSMGGIVLTPAGAGHRVAGATVELFVSGLAEPLVAQVGKRADFSFVNIPVLKGRTTWACFRVKAEGFPVNDFWAYALYPGRGASLVNLGISRRFPGEKVYEIARAKKTCK